MKSHTAETHCQLFGVGLQKEVKVQDVKDKIAAGALEDNDAKYVSY